MSCFKVPPESPSSEDIANAVKILTAGRNHRTIDPLTSTSCSQLRPYSDAPAWMALSHLAKCKEPKIIDAMAREIQWLTDEQVKISPQYPAPVQNSDRELKVQIIGSWNRV